jgi:hypothetical protein
MLKRFWFVTSPDDRFGVRNFGVTAVDKDEATDMLLTYLTKFESETIKCITKNTEIIEDIDIQLLDINHIIPNMGVVTFKGIWWPNLNL